MAFVANYLVIGDYRYSLGTPNLKAFNFPLPFGLITNKANPLLHYRVNYISTPGLGIAVELNGREIDTRIFLDRSQEIFVELILIPAIFNSGNNTLIFRLVSPTIDPQHGIDFSSVILWYRRDSLN